MTSNSTTSIDIVPVKRPGRFTDAIDAYFAGVILQKYVGESIDRALLESMQNDVLGKLRKIIHAAKFSTHDDLVCWLSQQYFFAININDVRVDQLLNSPTERSLSSVPESDLRRFAEIYRETDIGEKLVQELQRRTS